MMQRGRMIPAMVDVPAAPDTSGWSFGEADRQPDRTMTLGGLMLDHSARAADPTNTETPRAAAAATLT